LGGGLKQGFLALRFRLHVGIGFIHLLDKA
jgi:hypothetical protein